MPNVKVDLGSFSASWELHNCPDRRRPEVLPTTRVMLRQEFLANNEDFHSHVVGKIPT
jgi:hypothetical protein